ncbi:SMP-30/gluconolactonase/LRE family protein [Chitinophaga lutea]
MKLKTAILSLFCAVPPLAGAMAQQATLEKIWSTDTIMRTPESVYFDAKANVLYVANIDGAPWGRDGKGSIAVLNTDGSVKTQELVNGLNAPKGMGLHNGRLFVADLNELVEIDLAKKTIVKKHALEGAENLNDVTVSPKGTVYVSDSRKKRVYAFEKGHATVLLDSANSGLKGPNGLLYSKGELLVLDGGAVNKADASNKLVKLVDVTRGTDGIEHVQNDEYVVSCWQGEIFYVDLKAGKATKMLDTQGEKLQTADIGYDAQKKIVYVPTFYGNRVTAYQLNTPK